jgi:hypothetical protein
MDLEKIKARATCARQFFATGFDINEHALAFGHAGSQLGGALKTETSG